MITRSAFLFMMFFLAFLPVSPLLLFAQAAPDGDSIGTMLFHYVQGIERNIPGGRNAFVKTQLQKLGVSYSTMAFDTIIVRKNRTDTINGENIIVHLGGGKQKIVVGAHYDAVPGAPGANDNGGGVAVLLGLLQTLKTYHFNHSIDFCFFDREEDGLIGSAFYVRRYDTAFTHLGMINLDVEGTGSEVYVGPVGGGDDERIMKYVRRAEERTHYPFVADSAYPDSDHESFANAKLENISISIVPHGDAKKLAKWAASGFQQFKHKEDVPEVLKVMHSPNDTSLFVTTSALEMSYTFTKETLLSLDGGEQ